MRHKSGKRDAKLVRSYQSGQKTAWDALCIEYEPRLAQFFYNRKIGNPEDVQDLAQDTLLIAMEVIHTIRNPERFNSWLFTIANRRRIKWLKERERRESYEPSEDEFTETAVVGLGPEHIAVNNEYFEIVMGLMAQLSENQRMAILLSANGMKQKEIAKTLKTTTDNVKVLVNRGRKKLKALLKTKYPDDMVDDEIMRSLLGK
ncbi:MAG: RNA polymerase sigma factor [Candidatus Poribacteria bacterium]|nr:RNA polymerase sigma factor [Candidatus Poribacteria bacterium]